MDITQHPPPGRPLRQRSRRYRLSSRLVSPRQDQHEAKKTINAKFNSYEGEIVTLEDIQKGGYNFAEWRDRHTKEIRFPEIESCAKSLKQEHGFQKLGAIGFCFGGWAVFQLGGKGVCVPFLRKFADSSSAMRIR